MQTVRIHFAPIQGYTDGIYRKVFAKHFEGVDFYYTPYFSVDNINERLLKKELEQAEEQRLIPQILPTDEKDLSCLLDPIVARGYRNININMGCPWPMVRNKGRGAQLILSPNKVEQLIKCVFEEYHIKPGIKTRLGVDNIDQLNVLLSSIPASMISFVTIHARTAVQMYKGVPNREAFNFYFSKYPQFSLIYNGDVFSYNDYVVLNSEGIVGGNLMLGRGILQNPFLPEQIKNKQVELPLDYQKRLLYFIEDLIFEVEKDSSDDNHALNRLKVHAFYFMNVIPEGKKWFKKLKKSKSLHEYRKHISHCLSH